MSYNEIDPGLRAMVEAAVDLAISRGALSKARIVGEFVSRPGVSRATLFRWVQQRVLARTLSPASERTLAPPADAAPTGQAAPPYTARDAARGEALALLPSAPEVRGLGLWGIAAVDLSHAIATNIRELTAAFPRAKASDGGVQNPRLMIQLVNAVTQQLALAARIRPSVEHYAAQERFMHDLVEVVIDEAPPVRDRLIGKMQLLRRRYSGPSGVRTPPSVVR